MGWQYRGRRTEYQETGALLDGFYIEIIALSCPGRIDNAFSIGRPRRMRNPIKTRPDNLQNYALFDLESDPASKTSRTLALAIICPSGDQSGQKL